MKCAVAIVLAFIGTVVANPIAPLGYGLGYPSYSVSSSVINHGLKVPTVLVSAPVVRPVVTAPIITAPIIKTPVISAPVSLGWGGYGLGGWGGYGLGGWGGYGLGGWSGNAGYGWGKGWH